LLPGRQYFRSIKDFWMSNDLPAMPPAPEEEPRQREPESVPDSVQAQAPAGQPGIESVGEVGARLAQLRTQRGMSLEDVSSRLKVAVVKLKALEGGDLSRLKDVTFALGVVRSYAKILGADPEPLVRVLRRAYGSSEQDLSMPASSGASLPRGKMSVNWRGAQPRRSGGWVWGIGVVVVVIVLVVAFRDGRQSAWLSHLKPKASDSTAVADNTAAAAPASAASDALWPASGAETVASVDNGTPGDAASAAAAAPAPLVASDAPAPASVPKPASAVKLMAAQVASASAVQSPAAASGASVHNAAASAVVAAPASAEAASEVAQPGAPVTLTFKVTEDSWISVRGPDGREIFSGLVHPGEGQQVEGTRPVKVTIGNVHGIDAMDIDGAEANLKQYLNSTGNVAHFTLP